MRNLLDEKYAVQPDILYFYSYNGQPLRELYPLWSASHKDVYKKHCEEFMKGENENGENCFNALRQVVKCEIGDKLLEKGGTREDFLFRKVGTVLWGLLPHSGFHIYVNDQARTMREDWTMSGQGIFDALSCGLRLEFAPIISKCREIKDGLFAGEEERRLALIELDNLLLTIRQMNFLGGVLTAWTTLSAAIVNAIRAILLTDEKIDEIPQASKEMIRVIHKKEGISETQRKRVHAIFGADKESAFSRILKVIDEWTTQYQNTVSEVVKGGLQKIHARKFYKPSDDRGLWRYTIGKPIAEIAAYANGLRGNENTEKVEKGLIALIKDLHKRLDTWIKQGIIDDGQAKKIIARYEKKGEIPDGMTEEFVRQLADEYRAFTYKG